MEGKQLFNYEDSENKDNSTNKDKILTVKSTGITEEQVIETIQKCWV